MGCCCCKKKEESDLPIFTEDEDDGCSTELIFIQTRSGEKYVIPIWAVRKRLGVYLVPPNTPIEADYTVCNLSQL